MQRTPLNTHADVSSEPKGLILGLSFLLPPYFVYARNEGDPRTDFSIPPSVMIDSYYSKTCLKRPLKNRQNKYLNDKL